MKHLQWKIGSINLSRTSILSSGVIIVVKCLEKKKRKQIDNHIYGACESTCHECSAKDMVENNKEGSVVEDVDSFMKKDMENKKIMRGKETIKIGSPQYEGEF